MVFPGIHCRFSKYCKSGVVKKLLGKVSVDELLFACNLRGLMHFPFCPGFRDCFREDGRLQSEWPNRLSRWPRGEAKAARPPGTLKAMSRVEAACVRIPFKSDQTSAVARFDTSQESNCRGLGQCHAKTTPCRFVERLPHKADPFRPSCPPPFPPLQKHSWHPPYQC